MVRAGRPIAYGIPAAMSTVAGTTYFRTSSTAQRNVSQDARNSIRAHGCALFASGITVNPSSPGTLNGAFAELVEDKAYSYLAPSTIDTRLNALGQTYQYYAIRRLKYTYSPSVGTDTTGKLYLGIYKDPDAADSNFSVGTPGSSSFSGGTPTNVMQCDPSLETPVWQTAAKEFIHQGTQLWQTYPDGEEPANERVQAAFVGLVKSTSVASGTAVNFGDIWLEYEVDFYVPGPPLGQSATTPDVLALESINLSFPATSGSGVTLASIPAQLLDAASDYILTGTSTYVSGSPNPINFSVGGISVVSSLVPATANGTFSAVISANTMARAIEAGAGNAVLSLINTAASAFAVLIGETLLRRVGKAVTVPYQ
jgi:hypothetical protein